MTDTWDSVMNELRSIHAQREAAEERTINRKRKLQAVLEDDLNEFQNLVRAEIDNMTTIAEAIDGQPLIQLREQTDAHQQLGQNISYAVSNYVDEQLYEMDR
jgi:hypothetical protein